MAQPKAKGSRQHVGIGIQLVNSNKNKRQILVSAQTACAYAITDAIAMETVQISSHSPNGPMFVKALTQLYCRCRKAQHPRYGISQSYPVIGPVLQTFLGETRARIHLKNKNQALIFNSEVSASLQLMKVWKDSQNVHYGLGSMICGNPGQFLARNTRQFRK